MRPLLVQGSFLKLLHLENSDSDWLSFLYSLSRGYVFCFPFFYRLSSFSGCLKTYEKRYSSLCPHCNNHETLHHILNFCSVFLNQGRYTWRHNSVLNHLVLALGSAYSASDTPPQIFADLHGHLSSSNSTIPSHVLPTSLRPDLVLLFPNRKIYYLELTVPFETNILSARLRKSDRY